MFRPFSNIWENFKEYIVLVVLIIICLFTLSINQKPAAKKVKSLAFGSFAAFSSVISDIFDFAGVRSENEKLRKFNAELMLQVSELRKFGIENSELKQLLSLKDSSNFPLIPATIISKSLSRSQNTITLNVGKNDGLKPGMPVINDQGLVGVVSSISDDFAIVQTLKNVELKLTVKDERSGVEGIMKWNGSELVMVDIPKTYDIQPGDRIVTSQLSSIVDVPVPIGMALGLSKVETGIFNEAKIKPYADFIKAEHVFVISIVESKQKNGLELNFFNRN
ncbi:MAG: rod shape-determining protein MreC [Ignavibacteriaceae bacterium]|jgi:rod shape-determining protein MreC